jgi:hypothetical protein
VLPLKQKTSDGSMRGVSVKFTSSAVKSAVGAAGIAAVTVFTAATAAAANPTIQPFGSSEQLVDGPLVTAYTVNNLQPSNATIPGYTPKGQLWQADVTAVANSGTVTPLVADFNARAGSGQNYRVIDKHPAPGGLSPAPLTQGAQANGTIYFDVTGPQPDSVVYNDGTQDVMIWTNAPAAGPGTAPAPGQGSAPAPGPGTAPAPGPGTAPAGPGQ